MKSKPDVKKKKAVKPIEKPVKEVIKPSLKRKDPPAKVSQPKKIRKIVKTLSPYILLLLIFFVIDMFPIISC